jgi:hypothetical protein
MDHPFSINRLRSIFVRLNETLSSRFHISRSAPDDSSALPGAAVSPHIVASWQNAERLDWQYGFQPLGQREGAIGTFVLSRAYGEHYSLKA